MSNNRFHAVPHIIALVLYSLLACLATWPLILHFNTHLPAIPSELGQDVWQHPWSIWWVWRALMVSHTNPYVTDMLFFPQGASLYLHPLNLPMGLLGLPLIPLFGTVTTYNLLTLLALVLVGYCSFLLARAVSQNPQSALVAGVIVLCSPYRLFELRAAQLPTLSDYGVPLTILAVLIALQKRTQRSALLVGFLLLLSGLHSWYHLFHLMIVLGCLALWRTIGAWRSDNKDMQRNDARVWRNIGLWGSLFLAPFVFPVAMESITTTYGWKSDELVISADLLLLIPRTGGVWQNVSLDWWNVYIFALVPTLLAVMGWVLEPKKSALWGTIAILLIVLSLGSWLRIGNQTTNIPMPYLLFRAIPVLDTLRGPMRMNLVATMMMAIIAALGLTRLWQSKSGTVSWAWAFGLVLVIAVESIRWPFPLVHAGVSPFYKQIANEPGEWSILELPLDRPDLGVLEMYQQTVHQHAILTGRLARSVATIPYNIAVPIAQIGHADMHPDIVSFSNDDCDQLLQALRIRYLIVRESPNNPGRAERQIATAHELLGPLTQVYSDSQLLAYRVDRVANWLDGPGQTNRIDPPLFLGLNVSWPKPERGNHGLSRWLPPEGGGLWTYTKQRRRVVLEVSLYSLPGERPMELWLNGKYIQTVPIADGLTPRRYLSAPFVLPSGPSLIELRAPQGGVSPQELGLGNDKRLLSFSVHEITLREVQ